MNKAIAHPTRMKCLLAITGALILLGFIAAMAYADTRVDGCKRDSANIDPTVFVTICTGTLKNLSPP